MSPRPEPRLRNNSSAFTKGVLSSKQRRHPAALGKRVRGAASESQQPYVPPEDWYEPSQQAPGAYRIIVQDPGKAYRHVVTPSQIRQRLAELPASMLASLEVVQLSRMTRKKKTFPCYGMQWGSAVYLYPIESSLVEYFDRPPRPSERIEARMYGGRWVHESHCCWKLVWTAEAIRDYYLNNILIHELGHLLDNRNSSYVDRERFAEWFAIEYGYKPSRTEELAKRAVRKVIRRHHAAG